MMELHPPGDPCDTYAWIDWADDHGFAYLHTESGIGVNGSRWLDRDRLKRSVYMTHHATEFVKDAKQAFVYTYEGLFVRGRMRKKAEEFWRR